MSFSDICKDNFQSFIEQFKDDYLRYADKFEKIANDVVDLEFKSEEKKLELQYCVDNLNEKVTFEILRMDEISSYIIDKSLTVDSNKHKGIMNHFVNELLEKEEELNKMGIIYEDFINEEQKRRAETKAVPSRVNPHIVHSRQTMKPFVVTFMHGDSQYKCNGCKETIPLKVPYLKHLEEYPAGSKLLRPHSYHISRDCIFARGFEEDYLSRIKVECTEEIHQSVINALEGIGFLLKNIKMNIDSDSGSDTSETMSQHSGASREPSSTVLFIYRRKHATQKKKVICAGCKEEIVPDSYLTRGHSFDSTFHLNKKCILADGVLSNDFRNVKCQVYKILRNHGELKQLLGCGFYFNNIIGNKPQNPNLKLRPQPPPPPPSALNPSRPSPKDIQYIFNNEAFTCEQIVHAERCRGCSDQVRKESMALRHKEQVPRDKLMDSPLISQFYHPKKNCLIDRGFTNKYLSCATCNVVLSGSDNLQQVRDTLVRCGFSSDNLSFSTADDITRQGAMSPCGGDKNSNESYLFIVNCTRHRTQCEGCGLLITMNQPCFLYGQYSVQDIKSRLFHISKECLNFHFNNSQILAMTCINSNSMVDISPMDIVKCGLVNIMTTLPSTAKAAPSRPNPFKSTRPRFVVDTSLDIVGQCLACKKPLQRDLYVLRALSSGHYLPVNMHLAATCVRTCGYYPQQLSQCELSFAVKVSTDAVRHLEQCGFKNIPEQ